jgi:hypothetical protein
MRRASLAAACLIGVLPVMAGQAVAESVSPYEMTYSARADTALRSAIEAKAGPVATLPKGADGIVLRWCRPEMPFGTWQFGSPATWRKLLDERACEIGWNGKVGFVDGKALSPER